MKNIFLLSLLLAACRFGYAQPTHLSVDNLTTDNGLPSNVVNAIVQDGPGYMWFATYRGVVRYDGYTMHTYNLRSTEHGWYNENVEVLFKDNRGNIWAGMRPGGVFRYDRATDRFIHYAHNERDKNSLPYNGILAFINGRRNDVWIMTQPEMGDYKKTSISRFDEKTGRFSNYGPGEKGKNHLDSIGWIHTDYLGNFLMDYDRSSYRFDEKKQIFVKLSPNPVHGVPVYYEKRFIWFITSKGLVKFDRKNKSSLLLNHAVNDSSSLPNDTVTFLLYDKAHRDWAVTNAGLSLFNPATNKFTNFSFLKPIPKGYYYFWPDKSGNFWFTNSWYTNNAILAYFNTQTGRYSVYSLNKDVPQSLKQGFNSFFVDEANDLWIGNVAGISRVNNVRSAFTSYTISDTSFTGTVKVFLEAGKNKIYLGTDRGLYGYDLEKHTAKRIAYSSDSLEKANGAITAMVKNDDGTLMIGSLNLVLFDPKNGASHVYKYNSKPVNCTSILSAGNGRYWIGTMGFGLLLFDRGTGKFTGLGYNLIRVPKPDKRKLDNMKVSVVYRDKSGAIWAGTYFGGLNRLNAKDSSFTSFFYRYPYMTVVNDIHEDGRGQFWVATEFNGLYLFDRKAGKIIKRFTQKDGLLSNGVDKIMEDKDGRIWLSNTLGLVAIDIKTFAVKKYTHDNSLPTNNINKLPYEMSDGTALYATLSGFFRFRFEDLKPDPDPPVVHIEMVLHSDPASSSGESDTVRALVQKQVELPYSQNRVTFTFVALHYSFPLASRYSYKLINFDNNWVSPQNQRSVTYNNLSPGIYIFHVKAANGDGVWNNKGDTFTLIIDAPWWLRWWAWLLWAVLFVSAIYAFVAYRSRKLLNEKKILEHKVHVRTEEVMQQKEEIQSQRDNLEKAFGDLRSTQSQLIQSEKMASLGELTAGIAHEIQNPLNFVNNFSEVNKEMLEELKAESEKPKAKRDEQLQIELINDLIQNEKKINHHGKRADSIVKGMLEHSRMSSGTKEPTDINKLADEFLRLSYQGLRAKDKSFNAVPIAIGMITRFDPTLPKINVVPQDIGRVFLNLFNNAFYAVNQKAKMAGADYKPIVTVETFFLPLQGVGGFKVKDNGIGIPDAIKEKIMQPFFTTKPTGEGTGLGLSLSYDMVVKGHGGSIQVNSVEGEGSEFIITLPLN